MGSLTCVFLLMQIFHLVLASLSPRGVNVCSATRSYTVYVRTVKSAFQRGRTVYYIGTISEIEFEKNYYCCSGWAQSGSGCPTPICDPGCQNGHCSSADYCKCNSGWEGSRCGVDIDECSPNSGRGPCQQICNNLPGSYTCTCKKGYEKTSPNYPKDPQCRDVNECSKNPCQCASNSPTCRANCINTIGSFQCKCSTGFELQGNTLTCADINECSSSNGGCQQICKNTVGSFVCACHTGYVLSNDKKTCDDVNECDTLNGGCGQICINSIGSFSCGCRKGYRKEMDGKTCKDINECAIAKPCDNINGQCQNTLGSYICSCNTGYKLLPDKKTCVDIDECAKKGDNKCTQLCVNTVGSYKCHCRVGYRLVNEQSGVSYKCDDVDECTEHTDNCQQICNNNVGSFTCSCRPGYSLESNKHSCKGLPCKTIQPPLNGDLKCSGYVTDQSCLFLCDDGFDIHGSLNRTCLASTLWSGDVTKCTEKLCPPFQSPMFGSTFMPCIQFYGSSCTTKCFPGYYMKGSNVNKCSVKSGQTYWKPNNATCFKNTPCTPNPCLHGGRCTQHQTEFSCDCEDTDYSGKTCEIGLLKVSPLPNIYKGMESPKITLTAKPDQSIKVTVHSSDGTTITIKPDVLYFYNNEVSKSFTITPTKVGKFSVSYQIQGTNEKEFQQTPPTTFYVSAKVPTIGVVDVSYDFFSNTCSLKHLSSVCSNNKKITLKSSCTSTGGFVTANNGVFNVPLSLVGFPKLPEHNTIIDSKSSVQLFFETRIINTACSDCKKMDYNTNTVNYLIEYGFFERSLLDSFSSALPWWLSVISDEEKAASITNLYAGYGVGNDVSSVPSCTNLQLKNTEFVVYAPNFPVEFQFLSEKFKIGASSEKYCFLIDLCGGHAYVSLPSDQTLDLSSAFANNGLPNMKLSVHQISTVKHEDCFKFKEMPKDLGCVKSELEISVEGSFQTSKSSLIFDGTVNVDYGNLEEALLSKFNSKTLMAFDGVIEYAVTLDWLGGKLNVKGNATEAFVDVGAGNMSACPLCQKKGFFIPVQLNENNFDFPSMILSLHPREKGLLFIPYNGKGGMVIGQNDEDGFNAKLRTTAGNQQTFLSKIDFLKSKYDHDYQIISRMGQDFISNVNDLQSDDSFTVKYKKLKLAKKHAVALQSAIKSLMKRAELVAQEEMILKRGVMLIDMLNALEITPHTIPIEVFDQGVILKYTGDLCIYKLCFKSMVISIQDAKTGPCSDCAVHDTEILINGHPRVDVSYSTRVSMDIFQQLHIFVNRKDNSFRGSFKAMVQLINTQEEINFNFDNDKITYVVNNVEVIPGLKFDVDGESAIESATWDSLVYNIQGEARNTTTFMDRIQTMYKTNALATMKRIHDLTNRSHEAEDKYKFYEKLVAERRKILLNVTRKYDDANANYLKLRSKFIDENARMRSYLDNSPELMEIIKNDVDSICTLKTCKLQCVSMPQCQVCQKELFKTVMRYKCEQVIKTTESNTVAFFDTTCNILKTRIDDVYTSKCLPRILEPVGAALRGVVSFVKGLFMSCYKSHEVITTKYDTEQQCTLTRMNIETLTRSVSICYNITAKVSTGYGQPKECNCKMNPCLVQVSDPKCIQENKMCLNKQRLFTASHSKIPKEYMDLRSNIESLNNKQSVAFLTVERRNHTKITMQHEYNSAINLFGTSKQEMAFAERTLADMQSLLKRDVCLSDAYKKNKFVSEILLISKIEIETTIPIVNNVQLQLYTQDKLHLSKPVIPVVYQFDHSDVSMEIASRKILNILVCRSDRYKRSAEEKEDLSDLPFEAWYSETLHNASLIQKSCTTLSGAIDFLKSMSLSIRNLTHHAIMMKELLNSSNIPSPTSSKNSSVVDASNKVLSNSHDIKNAQIEKYNNTNILKQARSELEFIVSVSNISSCFSFEDCTKVALHTIKSLPLVSNLYRNSYVQLLESVMTKIKSVFVETLHTLEQLMVAIEELVSKVQELETASLHCRPLPTIQKILPRKVTLMAGDKFELICEVPHGELTVKIFWLLNKRVLSGENASVLSFNATIYDTGVYTCLALTVIGNSTSNGTSLHVFSKPYVTVSNDTTVYLPQSGNNISLECNVTGVPQPEIQWFYKDFYTTSFREMSHENQSLLVVDIANNSTSGFYMCNAVNKYGSVNSSAVRLDVLNSTLAKQSLFVSAVVKNQDDKSRTYKHFEKILQISPEQVTRISRNGSRIQFNLLSTPISPNFTYDAYFSSSASSRQNLANSGATFVNNVTKLNGVPDDNDEIVIIDNTTFEYNTKLVICPSGYQPVENGFACGQCALGTFGESCELCPLNTYQSSPGMKSCIKCEGGKITKHRGAMRPTECIGFSHDVILLVDTTPLDSRSYPQMIQNVAKDMFDKFMGKRVRFGLIGYSRKSTVYLNLDQPPQHFLDASNNMKIETGFFHFYRSSFKDGLAASKDMFLQYSQSYNTKTLVSIMSMNVDLSSNVVAVRKLSVELHNDNVEVFTLSHNIFQELHLFNYIVASYPRVDHMFVRRTANIMLDRMNAAFDKDYEPRKDLLVDIGVLFEPVSYLDEKLRHKQRNMLHDLLFRIWDMDHEHFSFGFIPANMSSNLSFSTLSNSQFEQRVNELTKSSVGLDSFHLQAAIEKVVNYRFTEQYHSIARTKVFIIVSQRPIDVEQTLNMKRLYFQEMMIVNFAYDFGDNSEPLHSVKDKLTVYLFQFYQFELFARLLHE